MYIHRVVRTQLYLDEAVHRRLSGLARKQGRTLSDLVREALIKTYGDAGAAQRQATLQAIEGLWRNRSDIAGTDAYVRRLRSDTRRPPNIARRAGRRPLTVAARSRRRP